VLFLLVMLGFAGLATLAFLAVEALRPQAPPLPDVERLLKESPLVVSTTADVTVTERKLSAMARVEPVPRVLTVAVGETALLSALVYDDSGHQVTEVRLRWSVADPGVGRISRGGVFRAAFAPGVFRDALVVEATSFATGDSVRAAVSVTIVQQRGAGEPTAILVFPRELDMEVGEMARLVAYATDTSGLVVPGVRLRWEVQDAVAGFIRQDGQFTAGTQEGTFAGAIRVSLVPADGPRGLDVAATVDVKVRSGTGEAWQGWFGALPQAITVGPGESLRFTAMALDARGRRVELTEIGWSVVDSEAGTISEDGVFRAGSTPGVYHDVVRVTATSLGPSGRPLQATATVVVTEFHRLSDRPGSPSRVVVFPQRIVLPPGESIRLTIAGLDAEGRPLRNTEARWWLERPDIGRITDRGVLTADSRPGTYPDAVHVEVKSEAGSQKASATLVILGTLHRVEIVPKAPTLAMGDRLQLLAVAYDENGAVLPTVLFRWSVADPASGAIDRRGLFTASRQPGQYPGAIRVDAVQAARSRQQ
jgi:hypothetical protein